MKCLLTLLLLIPTPLFAVAKPSPRPAAARPKLPLIEVPATSSTTSSTTSGTSDTLVVFVSGDGGWAAIDKSIARVLAESGMPVVGLHALQYFWPKRPPDGTA